MRMRRPSPASPARRSRAPPRSPSRFTNGGLGVAAQTTSRHLGARQIRAIPEGEDGFWQRAGEYWWQGMNAGEDDARLTVTGKYIALDRNFAVIAKGDFAWSAAFKSSEKPATYAPRGRYCYSHQCGRLRYGRRQCRQRRGADPHRRDAGRPAEQFNLPMAGCTARQLCGARRSTEQTQSLRKTWAAPAARATAAQSRNTRQAHTARQRTTTAVAKK
jgi:hypothetical protein